MNSTTQDTKSETKPCCTSDSQEKKLVRATDLPIHGNPFPPKDTIKDETPGLLESKISSIRTTIQPYVTPLSSAYGKTSDILSIGVAHTQSTINRLAENQNTVLNAGVISAAGVIGFALAGRGILKRLLFGTVGFSVALVACYPTDAEEAAAKMMYIARNKLPVVAQQQYVKFFAQKDSSHSGDTESKTSGS